MTKLQLRKIHRWLGLFAGIQLLAWTLSGLYFTVIPIDTIHGDDWIVEAAPQVLLSELSLVPANQVVASNPELADSKLSDLKLGLVDGRAVYNIKGLRIDAQSGELLPIVSEDIARRVLVQRTQREVATARLLEFLPVDHEFRNGELPVWQLTLVDVDNVNFYVGATTGRLRSVRTEPWRWFDFLWSLHIMDYDERANFNHLLIQFMAVLGVITVMSGLTLFAATQRKPKWLVAFNAKQNVA